MVFAIHPSEAAERKSRRRRADQEQDGGRSTIRWQREKLTQWIDSLKYVLPRSPNAHKSRYDASLCLMLDPLTQGRMVPEIALLRRHPPLWRRGKVSLLILSLIIIHDLKRQTYDSKISSATSENEFFLNPKSFFFYGISAFVGYQAIFLVSSYPSRSLTEIVFNLLLKRKRSSCLS